MSIFSSKKIFTLILLCLGLLAKNSYADNPADPARITDIVNGVIEPLMQKHQIPGMAVAVTLDGKNYFYNYGVASKETRQPITNQTLFEIGSISKTFTATLAAYAVENKHLSLADMTSHYLPELSGSSFDKISLLNLGTQTSGLPLFVPDDIKTNQQLTAFLQHWRPEYPAGSHRVYSNMGIGLLGVIAAKSMQGPYDSLLTKWVLNPLGLQHTYVIVPADKLKDYAQGYTDKGAPVRVTEGVLWQEAYGIKSSTVDLIRFAQANMQEIPAPAALQRAILNTHTAYFKSDYLTQDLIWEQYPYPATLKQVLTGNGDTYIEPTPVTKITPPLKPQTDVLINKTGSTNGFSSYVLFVPEKRAGVVILSNKAYPIAERVEAGYSILLQLIN